MPVFSALEGEHGVFDSTGEVSGTCFLLGEGFLLTAGHVAHSALSQQRTVVVGMPNPGSSEELAVMSTIEVEPLSPDLAIVQVKTTRSSIPPEGEIAFRWDRRSPSQLDPVWTIGFAYGTQTLRGRSHVLQRAFTGHIVTGPMEYELPVRDAAPFTALEVSFQAPRGLSGAPLLSGSRPGEGSSAILGVVIGNSASRMLVHQAQYREDSASAETIVEHYESLSLGLVVHASAILPIPSRLLGCTIGAYLEHRGRLVPKE